MIVETRTGPRGPETICECRQCWRLFVAWSRRDEELCPACLNEEAARRAIKATAAGRRRKRGHS